MDDFLYYGYCMGYSTTLLLIILYGVRHTPMKHCRLTGLHRTAQSTTDTTRETCRSTHIPQDIHAQRNTHTHYKHTHKHRHLLLSLSLRLCPSSLTPVIHHPPSTKYPPIQTKPRYQDPNPPPMSSLAPSAMDNLGRKKVHDYGIIEYCSIALKPLGLSLIPRSTPRPPKNHQLIVKSIPEIGCHRESDPPAAP